jgi:1,4-alpha-glucan branching enzyme
VETVFVAGSFNNWNPTGQPMEGPDAEGNYTATLQLEAGVYEYKYVLDGTRWRFDPGNPKQVGFYRNSQLTVGP